MNEPIEQFEAELSRLRPRRMSAELIDRIGAQLDPPAIAAIPRRTWGDRCLMTFMTGGALAASVIVVLIGWQVIVDRAPAANVPAPGAIAQGAPASLAEYQLALARSDAVSLEWLK